MLSLSHTITDVNLDGTITNQASYSAAERCLMLNGTSGVVLGDCAAPRPAICEVDYKQPSAGKSVFGRGLQLLAALFSISSPVILYGMDY